MSRVSVRDEYAPKFGRQNLTLWSGAFASDFEGWAFELPNHNGFMVTLDHFLWSEKFRVECESPRDDENWMRVDEAIADAVEAFRAAKFNPHGNKTADGVLITEGLRVFTNEMDRGVVTGKKDGGDYGRENDWWWTVKIDTDYKGNSVEKISTMNGERLSTTFRTYEGKVERP